MPRIQILDDGLINRIAAGEVVERPAAVVKELVENSLDAGATEIEIALEKAGRKLISVADNGCGMDQDECLLALERHATSKISVESDLLAISTLGFRGEALPAIAAVSRLRLTSRPAASEVGARLVLDAGVLRQVEQVGCPVGTQIEVRDLFFNTPARRRFLRSPQTELGHVVDQLTRIALARPAVRFALNHDGRNMFTLPPAHDALERVAVLLGDDVQAAMIPLNFADNDVDVRGGVTAPSLSRGTARQIFALVNGRPVRDRVVTSAVIEGFRDHMMRGRFPLAVLDLRLPADMVDVNVHPAKTEVRFRDGRAVFAAISEAVRGALLRQGRVELEGRQPDAPAQTDHARRVERAVLRFAERHSGAARGSAVTEPLFHEAAATQPAEPARLSWRPIGQVLNTYILAEDERGLVLIDQHAAHERVVYERLLAQLEEGNAQSQTLLLPITLDLRGAAAAALERLAPELERFGLSVERFGQQTFVIKSVPALVPEPEAAALVRDLVDDVLESGASGRLEDARDRLIERIACHGAIRAGQALDEPRIRRLLDELAQTANPEHCPHGRPTIRRLTAAELERMFKRT